MMQPGRTILANSTSLQLVHAPRRLHLAHLGFFGGIAVLCHVQAYPGRHGMGPTHPEHLIGTSLHKLQVGQTIDIKGPFGEFTYQPGQYKTVGASCFALSNDTAVLKITPRKEGSELWQ